MKAKFIYSLLFLSLLTACQKDREAPVMTAKPDWLTLGEVKAWYGSPADSGRQTNSGGFDLHRLKVDFRQARAVHAAKTWWAVPLPGRPVFQGLAQGYRKLAFFRQPGGVIGARILEVVPDGLYLQLRKRGDPLKFTGRVFVYDQSYHFLKGAVWANGKLIGVLRPGASRELQTNSQLYEDCQWYQSGYMSADGEYTVFAERRCEPVTYDDGESLLPTSGGEPDFGQGGGGDGGSTAPGAADDAPAIAELPGETGPAIDPKEYMRCFGTLPDAGSSLRVTVYVQEPFPGTNFNVGPNSVGHVAIGLSKSYGGSTITQVVGFYPNATGLDKLAAPSKINDNSALEYNVSISYEVSAANFNKIVDYVATPPFKYSLVNFNCTNFVYSACQAGGITLPNPYQPLLFGATEAMTPGVLGLSIGNLPDAPNINKAGGTAPNSKGPCN
jgi:hypothetical protein